MDFPAAKPVEAQRNLDSRFHLENQHEDDERKEPERQKNEEQVGPGGNPHKLSLEPLVGGPIGFDAPRRKASRAAEDDLLAVAKDAGGRRVAQQLAAEAAFDGDLFDGLAAEGAWSRVVVEPGAGVERCFGHGSLREKGARYGAAAR